MTKTTYISYRSKHGCTGIFPIKRGIRAVTAWLKQGGYTFTIIRFKKTTRS